MKKTPRQLEQILNGEIRMMRAVGIASIILMLDPIATGTMYSQRFNVMKSFNRRR